MTDQLHARLKQLAKECGGNRALCDKSGISERTFANWLAGSSEPKVIGIAAIARAAGVTIDWIVYGTKPKYPLNAHRDERDDVIQIPLLGKNPKAQTSSGENTLTLERHIPFASFFLQARLDHTDFNQLCILQAHGDSMIPTISSDDYILIDRNHTNLEDGIYSFLFKGQVNIKRIINVLNGVEVISDNQSLYPPYHIEANDLQHLHVIGRAIWVGKFLP